MASNAGALEPCPICGDLLSARQLSRHRAHYRLELEQNLAMLDDQDDPALHNAGLAHTGVGPVLDGADPGPGDIGMVEQEDEEADNDGDAYAAEDEDEGEDKDESEDEDIGSQGKVRYLLEPDAVADMSLVEDDNELPAPPPQLPPAHGLRQNPPVTIEDWPDPDDSSANSDNDGGPVDNGEQDPPYIERDVPLRLDPNDEPALDDNDLLALLEAELGDLADEEWIDMCKCY
ncbi:hypothetical protein BDV93DRAFT_510182 [Ceratobasidium sp. AG-I]|nr:hypothetical protein BDV93DRAFT_510182 [Ceratobasidium sp. AG-I]